MLWANTGWCGFGRLLHHAASASVAIAGDYLPLETAGDRRDNAVAFARSDNEGALVVIAPRQVFDALNDGSPQPAYRIGLSSIRLPPRLAHRTYRNVWTG
jgi:(1->4)-alpha-D-glucan 1-alpha-D-glucosylmutase